MTQRLTKRSRRPVILVTGPDQGGWPAWFFTALAVFKAGGRPVRIRPAKPAFPLFDGLIIGGGADVSPKLYDSSTYPGIEDIDAAEQGKLNRLLGYMIYPLLWAVRRLFQSHTGVDIHRDKLETALLTQALQQAKPVLGICRGMQLINVLRGGSLYRDLSSFYTEIPQTRSLLPVKEIYLHHDSRLASILGCEKLHVNALHNHAVAQLGHHIKICAQEKTGVIQGIEASDTWCIGVQWHPEYLPHKSVQQHLFKALVAAAKSSPL